jgi:D-xylonolactonase
MYFADTVARCIYAYDWRRKDGALQIGVPDGLAVDARGFVWCAHWFGDCLTRILRVSPQGQRRRDRGDVPPSRDLRTG